MPCSLSKEPCSLSKKPCSLSKELCSLSIKRSLYLCQKSPILSQKSPVVYNKRPVVYQKSSVVFQNSRVGYLKRPTLCERKQKSPTFRQESRTYAGVVSSICERVTSHIRMSHVSLLYLHQLCMAGKWHVWGSLFPIYERVMSHTCLSSVFLPRAHAQKEGLFKSHNPPENLSCFWKNKSGTSAST